MRKLFLGIMAMVIISVGAFAMPVMAKTGGKVETSILKSCGDSDDGKGSGIICILRFGITIFSALVAILGVLGITFVGIQYLTAGGDVGKMAQAKRRLLEIVIGLALYATLYATLSWLLPGFSGVQGPTGGQTTTNNP